MYRAAGQHRPHKNYQAIYRMVTKHIFYLRVAYDFGAGLSKIWSHSFSWSKAAGFPIFSVAYGPIGLGVQIGRDTN